LLPPAMVGGAAEPLPPVPNRLVEHPEHGLPVHLRGLALRRGLEVDAADLPRLHRPGGVRVLPADLEIHGALERQVEGLRTEHDTLLDRLGLVGTTGVVEARLA